MQYAVPNLKDLASFQSYLTQIVGVFKEFGGTNFQRFKTVEQIIGLGGIRAIAMVEFPNSVTIHRRYKSKAFNA